MMEDFDWLETAVRAVTSRRPSEEARGRTRAAALAAFDLHFTESGGRERVGGADSRYGPGYGSGGPRAGRYGRYAPKIAAVARTKEDIVSQLIVRAGEDGAFRTRLLADPPSAVEEETGLAVPSGFRIEVHEQGVDIGHLVLPPAGRLSDAELGAIAGGNMWSSSDTEK